MAARTKARRRALDLLFSAELREEEPVALLERAIADGEPPNNPYTADLVRGVAAHLERIDELISAYAQDWTLPRMPAVDRNVIRMALWEILWSPDVPGPVAVSEAMGLVRDLSTDESPSFVNGVLGAILRDRSTLQA